MLSCSDFIGRCYDISVRRDHIDKGFVEKLLRDIDDAIAIISSDASKSFKDLSRAEKSEIRYYLKACYTYAIVQSLEC